MRQKLDEYYAGQGLHSGVVIRLPKAGYVPQIERRVKQDVEPPAVEIDPALETAGKPSRLSIKWIWILATVAAAAIVMALSWGLSANGGGNGGSQTDAFEAVPFARGGSQARISPDGARIAYRCGGREGRICVLTRATRGRDVWQTGSG